MSSFNAASAATFSDSIDFSHYEEKELIIRFPSFSTASEVFLQGSTDDTNFYRVHHLQVQKS